MMLCFMILFSETAITSVENSVITVLFVKHTILNFRRFTYVPRGASESYGVSSRGNQLQACGKKKSGIRKITTKQHPRGIFKAKENR